MMIGIKLIFMLYYIFILGIFINLIFGEKFEDFRNKKIKREQQSQSTCCLSCKNIEYNYIYPGKDFEYVDYNDLDEKYHEYLSENGNNNFFKKNCENEEDIIRSVTINGNEFKFSKINDEIILVSVNGSKKNGLIILSDDIAEEKKKLFTTEFKKFYEEVLTKCDIYINIGNDQHPFVVKSSFSLFSTYKCSFIKGNIINITGDSSIKFYFIPLNFKDQIDDKKVNIQNRYLYDIVNEFLFELSTEYKVDITKVPNDIEPKYCFLYRLLHKSENDKIYDIIFALNTSKKLRDYDFVLYNNRLYKLRFVDDKNPALDEDNIAVELGVCPDFKFCLAEMSVEDFNILMGDPGYKNVTTSLLLHGLLKPEYCYYQEKI